MQGKNTASPNSVRPASGKLGVFHSTAHRTLLIDKVADGPGILALSPRANHILLESGGKLLPLPAFVRGGGPAVQAFASGSVDLCVCAADHVVRLVNRSFDARIVGRAELGDGWYTVLIPDPGPDSSTFNLLLHCIGANHRVYVRSVFSRQPIPFGKDSANLLP